MMKKPSSLFALLFLSAFITCSPALAGAFVDTDGDIIRNGGAYYIRPHIWALGGGVRIAKTGNETCPLSVVQSPSEVDIGLPWSIASPLRIGILSTNMLVGFFSVEGKVPSCFPEWSSWNIVEGENGIKSVQIKSVYESKLYAPFKFVRYNSFAYKIMYCASSDSCEDVGVSVVEGKRRLVLSPGNPLPVVLTKAKSSQPVISQVVKNVQGA